jgi:transglutaminase-like putative cysteine protease
MFLTRKSVCFYSLLLTFILIFSMSSTLSAEAALDIISRAAQLELGGQFLSASNVLNLDLATNQVAAQREQIAFELDRLNRICLDFNLSQDDLFVALQLSVSGLTTNEFQQWVREGRFDTRTIDGRVWFMRASVSNLYFRYPELAARRLDGTDRTNLVYDFLASCRTIKQAARQQGTPYVLPKQFEVTMNLSVNPGIVPDGQTVRAWLPIPRDYPYQTNFELISSSPVPKAIAPGDSSIRSVYFEQVSASNQPASFTINYKYTRYGVSFDINPKRVTPFDDKDPAIAQYTKESPHVVFTPEMRALSQKIGEGEKNPALLAKKFYDWIGVNTHYSYAIEYSTIRNISDYCLSRGYGDCGQEALLFIALCRLNGIPARWQSGWHTFPGVRSNHDWAEIYLNPYGWVPVDPYMCVMQAHYATALTPEQRLEIRDFYFGGLDQWRIAANSDHSVPLTPPKDTFRSDNVDFQRGEAEFGNHNLYFNQFNYSLNATDLSSGSTTQASSK